METKSGDSTLLIDFSSPVSKRTLHTPLIPVPNDVNCIMSVSPSNTNPFDIMVKKTISPENLDNDPFECASKTTPTNLNINEKESFETIKNSQVEEVKVNERIKSKTIPTNLNINEKESFERIKNSQVEKVKFNERIKYLSENVNTEEVTGSEKNKQSCDNRLPVEFEKTNDLFDMSANDKEVTTVQSKMSTQWDDNSLSQVSGDFSTEEGIKATIAKRVNKCIQQVLSNSMLKKKGDHKQCRPTGVNNYRKSSSFTTTTTSNQVCDRLNKSCSECFSTDDSFIVGNHNLRTPESSICSCDATPLSFLSGEDLQHNESVNLSTENDDVFQEANKLAHRLSKIADSFSKNTDEVDNDDDDLLSCKPQWLYADSSEDEDEKLKKDPALNIRVSFTNSKPQDQPDSDALSAFKTRVRRSFSHLQTNDSQIESSLKRCLSIGSKPTVVPVAPTIVSTSVPIILEKHNDNLLKLKKKPLGELRKGPMRAVMPVQNMAKESLASGVQSARNRVTSPIRKKSSSQIMVSPIKDASQINMCPVASSTPNKCSPATPLNIVTPLNSRHSFGSTTDNRKSRNPLVESGSRQRSSSANSSIPTALAPAGRTLGPKSKSNLIKGSNTAKISPHHDKESEKNVIKQIGLKPNFNPKALNEVKPKIVRPSRIKSTVNAISNVITGKSKKADFRDKENRFPA